MSKRKGKGKKKKQKGQGMAKTLEKTQRKQQRRQRKQAGETGEADLDLILDEFRQQDQEDFEIQVEENTAPPNPRSNASLCPNPRRPQELILFGGEFFDGRVHHHFNDLYLLNTETQKWTQIHTAKARSPLPRTAHQAVCVEYAGKHWMYLFGGEYTTPSGNQLRHFKDLWRLDLKTWEWECLDKVVKGKGPSARSGHRMALHRNQLVVFSGFFDTGFQLQQFNDLYTLDLRTLTWKKIQPAGGTQWPSARSAACFGGNDHFLFLYGGYKINPEAERGAPLDDVWAFDLSERTATKLSESNQKFAPTPRSGASMVLYKNMALMFGGVTDKEIERGEDFSSNHHNEMFRIRLSGLPGGGTSVRWEPFIPGLQKKGKKARAERRDLDRELEEMEVEYWQLAGHTEAMANLRPAPKETLPNYVRRTFEHWYNDAGLRELEEAEQQRSGKAGSLSRVELEQLQTEQETEEGKRRLRRAAFAAARLHYMTAEEIDASVDAVDSALLEEKEGMEETLPTKEEEDVKENDGDAAGDGGDGEKSEKVFIRGDIVCPRRNAMLCVQGDRLFLYGGVVEQRSVQADGDVRQHREITLADVYELDLRKPDKGWKRLQEASRVRSSRLSAEEEKSLAAELDELEIRMWGDWEGSEEEDAEELEDELREHLAQGGGEDDDEDEEEEEIRASLRIDVLPSDVDDDGDDDDGKEEDEGDEGDDESDEGDDDDDPRLPRKGESYKDYLKRVWFAKTEGCDKATRAKMFAEAKEIYDEHSDM